MLVKIKDGVHVRAKSVTYVRVTDWRTRADYQATVALDGPQEDGHFVVVDCETESEAQSLASELSEKINKNLGSDQ